MSLLSERLSTIKPSPTLAVVQKTNELKKQGKQIISLGAGEPDFDTPGNIKQAAVKAINEGFTKYTNVDGMPELKKAIQNKFQRENQLTYDLNEIIVSCGGKQVIYNLFMASLNTHDEVIIPTPYWVSYPDIVLLAGGKPVFIECTVDDNFKLSPEKLEKSINQNTKWLILNSPSNPTGASYTQHELQSIAEILSHHPHVMIMTDDIYEHITFDNFKFYTLPTLAPELKDRTFIVNGVSKSYSMTGWRIGYGAGNKELIKAMSMIQSQSTSNPCSISQMAAIEALNGIQDFIKTNAHLFQQKRDIALKILNNTKGLSCYKSEGAFYLFPKCKALFGTTTPQGKLINNSNDLAEYFLEEAGVAVVPGIAFGLEGYFRISYATSFAEIEAGCDAISIACGKLK